MWLLHRYVAALKSHPYSANSCSALVVCSAGDALAQAYDGRDSSVERTAKLAGWGAGWMGPAGVVWYGLLERLKGGVALKVAVNQAVFAPTTNALFYFYNEAWQASPTRPLKERYYERMSREFLPTMLSSVAYWVPTQAFNLSAVPLHFRPLFLNTAFIFWTAYLSFRGHRRYDDHDAAASKVSSF